MTPRLELPRGPITEDEWRRNRRRPSNPHGYFGTPGKGPPGQTCKTCAHSIAIVYSKRYYKCELMRPHWTGGYGTDIRLKSPACEGWKERK